MRCKQVERHGDVILTFISISKRLTITIPNCFHSLFEGMSNVRESAEIYESIESRMT
jgi:hypothetical protein